MIQLNYAVFGALSIVAGIVAVVGIIGFIPTLFAAPVSIVSGIVSIRKGYKVLGWTGIAVSVMSCIGVATLLYTGGWL